MSTTSAILNETPKTIPALEPAFRPASLATRAMKRLVMASRKPVAVGIAIEQADGSVFHFRTEVLPESDKDAACNAVHIERLVKFMLWSRGGYRVHIEGPKAVADSLRAHYTEVSAGKFDAEIMGGRIYEKPFEVVHVAALPKAHEATMPLGRHLEGCRIGFDLGASDRKVAAVVDGKVVFSEEMTWDPVKQTDPKYHYDEMMAMLTNAAKHMPCVDAIGGSAAGVYVNNRVKVASLFRGISNEKCEQAKNVFLDLKKAWKNVPFEVVNDGEVTALAGSMSLNDTAVLGIALGSSQAGGYCTREGNITSWLNELAFVPVDYNPDAAVDEWSGDYGCGVQYFSQQCVGRLLKPAGIEVDAALSLPEKLVRVQELMKQGDARARKIYETVGTYLGYAVAHYADFYDIKNVLILGRVTSGEGGAIILDFAKDALKAEFPELFEKIKFHTPDERDKRHGQAIAAASLPVVDR